jgi:branched-chain amino acid aminotransferase
MNKYIHFLNGKFVSEDELLISPRDLGYVRGYAVADFLVTYGQKPFKLLEHIDRLFKSAEIIGLQIPWNKIQIADWIKETINRNSDNTEKTIKIILSGGNSHTMKQANIPTLVMIVDNFIPPPPSYYKNGVKIKTVKYTRPYPEAKSTFYVEAIKQLSLAKNNDITEVVYYNDSHVFEGAGSNVFAVINNSLVTPQSNIVQGITRNVLLEILQLNIPIEIRDFTFNELLMATEVFLTGSAKGVRGVVEINGKTVGTGKVGHITKEVTKQYKEYVIKEHLI